jgi:hypothetical protein
METDSYWADPDAPAEAMRLRGAGANEDGVFCPRERVEIAGTPHAHAALLIAESGNGPFGYGYQTGGSHCLPCVCRAAIGSRDEPRAAAVPTLLGPLRSRKTPDRRAAALALAKFGSAGPLVAAGDRGGVVRRSAEEAVPGRGGVEVIRSIDPV